MIWQSLRELPPWLRVFVFGRFFRAASSTAWLFLTVYLVQDRGITPAEAGLIVGVYGGGIIVGNLTGGWFGDRFGTRRIMIISQLGWTLACVLVPFVPTVLLLPLTLAGGLVAGTSHPLGMALVTEALPPEKRRTAVALSRAAMNGGVVIGPPVGALVAAYDFSWVFVIDAIGSAAMALLIWRWIPIPKRHNNIVRASGSLWRAVRADRTMWTLLLAVMAVDVAFRQLYNALPLVLSDGGTHLIGYGALIAGSCIFIVLAETPIAIKLAHRPALKIIPWGYACVGLGFIVLSIWPRYAGAVVAIAIITVGEMLYKPTSSAYAADRAPEGMNGRYQSLYSAASITGMVLAPPLGGTLYQYAPSLLWPVCAVLGLGGAAGLAFGARRSATSARTVPTQGHPIARSQVRARVRSVVGPEVDRFPAFDDRIPRQIRHRYNRKM